MVTRVDDGRRRRLLVARHQLDAAGRDERDAISVAEALRVVHSTDPVTPHLGIRARSAAQIGDIDDAFYVERSLLRHTTIRRTVFAMPLDVAPVAHGAFNTTLVAKLRSNLVAWIDVSPDTDDDAKAFLAAVEREVVEWLIDHGSATGTVLADEVPGLRVRFDPAPGKSYSRPMRITSKVLEVLAAEGRIARGRPTGRDFTSAAWTWAPIDDWIDSSHLTDLDPAQSLTALVELYLGSYGPATLTDIAWWTGMAKGPIKRSLAALRTVDVELDHSAEPGHVLPSDDLDAPPLEGSVALLPGLDSTTMGWKQRSWYVDDTPSTGLFDRNGNAGPTIWFDGRVVGSWTQRPDGTIATTLTEPVAIDLDQQLEQLIDWLGDVRIKWRYPTPITKYLTAD